MDFDTRVYSLEPTPADWEEQVKKQHEENRTRTIEELKYQFGEWAAEAKIRNFADLDIKPFSILAYHNKFLEQIRNSFVIGSYYPALTGACALGERILNHLVITLREYHKHTPEYKSVYRQSSFDNWPLVISTLEAWEILLPVVSENFRKLNEKRNKAIHFDLQTERDDREIALQVIKILQEIIANQFPSLGTQPWFFWVPGECYIKKEWEEKPFVKVLYLPNCGYVGYKHKVESISPKWVINDQFEYEEVSLTDEEYAERRKRTQKAS